MISFQMFWLLFRLVCECTLESTVWMLFYKLCETIGFHWEPTENPWELTENPCNEIHIMDRFLAYCPFCELIAAAYASRPRRQLRFGAPHWIDTTHFNISINISIIVFICQNNVCQKYLPNDSLPKSLRRDSKTTRLHRKTIQRYPKRLDPEMLSNTIQKYLGRSSGHSIAIITKDDQMLDQRKIHYPVPLQFYCSSLMALFLPPAFHCWLSYPSIHLIKLLF